jgi:amino acid transporter
VIISLLIAGGLHALTAFTYGKVGLYSPASDGEIRVLRTALGPLPATVLPLCARVVYTVCAATGILAIAGYVFNEVFVYWFPNLGFSFCLLGALLGLNVVGPRAAALAQFGFVTLALGGLLCLSAVALRGLGQPPPVPAATVSASSVTVRGLLMALLLFIGFELALYTTPPAARTMELAGRLLTLSLILAGLVWCIWSLVSVRFVPAARLAESTVPHMLAARAIFGHSGRVIMGMVVLAGTCATVNALLGAGARMLAGMAAHGLLPACLGAFQARPALLLLALGPAMMMAMGMAGEPETELYARAGALFWLLHYAAIHLAVLVGPRRRTRQAVWTWGPTPVIMPLLSLAVLSLSILGLVWSDHEALPLVQFMGIVSASTGCLSLTWLGWRHLWLSWRVPGSAQDEPLSTGQHPQCKGDPL